ncbi:DUF4410 domain-containing protein [Undibacterium sp. TJN19]|uniref:DUF4410 domain-containing protein n=1 Tax=Undibacterium sp. TJN19 TaxID=3413055 RepID=UPI003BF369D5
MFARLIVTSLIAFSLVGCASGVKHADISNKQYLSNRPAKSISISLSDDAKKQVSDNLKFDQNALVDNVKRAMSSQNLLSENNPEATNTVEILVKDFRVRSAFTAIMFGFMAGNDHIVGDVILKDATGKEINRFEISASYALGGLAGGQDGMRLSWLYEKFAELTVEHLRGKKV